MQNMVGDSSAAGSFVRGEMLKLLQDFMARLGVCQPKDNAFELRLLSDR